MKFRQLLLQRDVLLRQARLANLAFAYQRVSEFTRRIERARLRGAVTFHPGDPSAADPWPRLVADEGAQSVIEEHFLDEDIVELGDILAFLCEDGDAEMTFRLEELGDRLLPRLREELAAGGVAPDRGSSTEDANRGAA
jgi:hypothetical protein